MPEASNARNEGCGRFRRKVTSSSPFVVTSARFAYQDLRGLRRSLSLALPVSKSQVHFTSLAVNGLPSCHLTPCRNGMVSSVPSSFHSQLVARSGTIDLRLFCGSSCLKMTRLLNMPIIGRLVASVDSSSIDMLAGLSKWPIRNMPPDFCAIAGCVKPITASNRPAVANAPRCRFIFYLPWFVRLCGVAEPLLGPAVLRLVCRALARQKDKAVPPVRRRVCHRLSLQPDVFEARGVEDAVDHQRHALHPRLHADRGTDVKDDRPHAVFGEFLLDLPHQLPPLVWVGLHRLPFDQRVEFGIAIAAVITLRAAHVILIKILVRVIEAVFADHQADGEVFAHDLGIPIGRVDGVEFSVDVDLLQLVDQDHRRVARERNVAYRELDRDSV